ncbi:hypothetical protein AMECASPLE_000715 [Ameca splendens]|uniref:Uncharacterized protein n=1 Tax=Ameca splendens TaxID=208324 RepID=A0ABV0XA65_9TELE
MCCGARMRVNRKKVDWSLWVRGQSLPQPLVFKYLVLFTSDGRMEREMDRWFGALPAVKAYITLGKPQSGAAFPLHQKRYAEVVWASDQHGSWGPPFRGFLLEET